MVHGFTFTTLPTKVIFGRGKRDIIGAEAEGLGLKRPLVITGRRQSALGAALARRHGWPHWDGARMHTPVEATELALAFYMAEKADGVAALGGGSSIGLGKALAFRTDCAQICLPTTFAGSEMTNVLGETANGAKTTRFTMRIWRRICRQRWRLHQA
jgi:maleylacetate reductase